MTEVQPLVLVCKLSIDFYSEIGWEVINHRAGNRLDSTNNSGRKPFSIQTNGNASRCPIVIHRIHLNYHIEIESYLGLNPRNEQQCNPINWLVEEQDL